MKKLNFLHHKKEKMRSWTERYSSGKRSAFWLSAVSFSESSFFPIPPDFLLIAILMTRERAKWLSYSTLTTIFSVLGGLFGYLLGFLFWESIGAPLAHVYHLEAGIAHAGQLFSSNAFFAVVFAAFMPIPEAYKISAIAAGLFHANIFVFIVASIIGRGLRFFAVGFLMRVYGEKITALVYDYLEIFFLLALAGLGVILYILL